MGSFVVVESKYPKVPELLLSEVQGFADSLEYERLDEVERGLPGVVASAFTRFFVRFQAAEVRGGLGERDAKSLADAYRAIEYLTRSSDKRVRTLVEDEIFENIRASQATWRGIESRFGPKSTTLFKEWRSRNPR